MNMEWLDAPAPLQHANPDIPISRLMHLIWLARPDLRSAFDLDTATGQREFADWFRVSAFREYGIDTVSRDGDGPSTEGARSFAGPLPRVGLGLHSSLIRLEASARSISRRLPSTLRKAGTRLWKRTLHNSLRIESRFSTRWSGDPTQISVQGSEALEGTVRGEPGVSLIGYARAELGMGEHVRMSAAALEGRSINWGVINYGERIPGRQKAQTDETRFISDNRYKCNLFHINADQMLLALLALGRSFFDKRYNVGYWAWELAHCPEEWDAPMALVDELWAPSRFIQGAFAERARVPVVHMPLCVSLPNFAVRRRTSLGLQANAFLFLFTFDFFSYVERKNPYGAIRAFKNAFPGRHEQVGLVIKAMNADESSEGWQRLLDLIDGDPRIVVINRTMDRLEVLQLFDACDCFVSLHRSEGFGRGPAEAMYLGKPVIVTNYSGNTDFTLSENSCLVDYRLIPVGKDHYVFSAGQQWADPDEDHASWHMKTLASDPRQAQEIGKKARAFIRSNFSPARIGTLYEERLRKLGLV